MANKKNSKGKSKGNDSLILSELRKLNRNLELMFMQKSSNFNGENVIKFDSVELSSSNLTLKQLEKVLNRILSKHENLLIARKIERTNFGYY